MLLDLGDSNSAYVSSEASVPFTHVFMISFPETILNRKVTIMSRSCRMLQESGKELNFFGSNCSGFFCLFGWFLLSLFFNSQERCSALDRVGAYFTRCCHYLVYLTGGSPSSTCQWARIQNF